MFSLECSNGILVLIQTGIFDNRKRWAETLGLGFIFEFLVFLVFPSWFILSCLKKPGSGRYCSGFNAAVNSWSLSMTRWEATLYHLPSHFAPLHCKKQNTWFILWPPKCSALDQLYKWTSVVSDQNLKLGLYKWTYFALKKSLSTKSILNSAFKSICLPVHNAFFCWCGVAKRYIFQFAIAPQGWLCLSAWLCVIRPG